MLNVGEYVDGKYKILGEISRGGMGVVYMAINEKVNKTWAVKVAQRNGLHDNNMAIQSLAADRRTLVGLSHPHLPSIVDVYETETSMMLVMDYIQGNPLSTSLRETGALPQQDVIRWVMQLCDVLGYLHSRNIIYRDLKPSNVMLKPDGNVVLIDFGATRQFKEKNLADTQCLGTVGYAAPEQFGGQGQTDARTDIYCLGATMHHLLTGIDPCRETSFRKVPIRQVNPSLSGGLERIIETCLQDDKRKRYQSCAALMNDLERYEEMDDAYRKKQRKRLALFAGTAFLALLLAASSFFGYAQAENQRNHDYALKLASAEDAQLPRDERVSLYLDAIQLNPSELDAYQNMLRFFLSGDEAGGSFSREEASIVTQLKAGLDTQDASGLVETVYPLDTLKARNQSGYEQICMDFAMAYWYDYEVASERYTSSIEWFGEAAPNHPIARTYGEIGVCMQDINRYTGQNRTEKIYESYGDLWQRLKTLENDASSLSDNDTKLLAWKAVVQNASEKTAYFLVSVDAYDMLSLLDKIDGGARRLRDETKFDGIMRAVDELQSGIAQARVRISAVR